jgi:large subunit ribosomal protein L13
MKTKTTKKKELTYNWHILDAKDQVLGRLATQVATLLTGKHKTNYSPNIITGDKVIILNSDLISLTGNKVEDKKYYTHSGYPKGLKERNAAYFLEKDSTYIVKTAISGMLPKNKLRKKYLANLYVYKGQEHPHHGQIK